MIITLQVCRWPRNITSHAGQERSGGMLPGKKFDKISPPEAEEIFKKSNKMEAFPYLFMLFGKAPYIPKIMSLLPTSPKIITSAPQLPANK